MEGNRETRDRIAALEKTVEILKEAEKNYRHLMQYAPTGIYELDYSTQRFLSVNDAACRMSGYTREEMLSMTPFKLLDAESAERFKDRLRKGLSGEKIDENVEYRIITKDGRYLWIVLHVKPVYKEGRLDRALVVGYDITEHKKADLALRDSEERFRLVAEAAKVLVYEVDLVEKKIEVFRGEEVLGYETGEIPQSLSSWFRQIHVEDRTLAQQKAQEAIETGNDTVIDYRIKRKQGDYIIVRDTSKVMKDEKGNVVTIVGGLRDITERKKQEEEIKQLLKKVEEERDRINLLLTSMPDEVWFANQNGEITLANPMATKEFELNNLETKNALEIAGKFEVYRSDGSPRPPEEAPPLRALKGEVITKEEEIVRTPASGELRYRQVNAVPVKDLNGKIIGSMSVVRDITEQKRAEKALEDSKNLYKTLFENTNDAFQLVQPIYDNTGKAVNFRILEVNASYELQVGIKASKVIGRLATDIDPNLEKEWIESHGSVATTGKSMRTELYNGLTKRWFDLYLFPFGKGLVGVLFKDITYRKDLEKQLQDNERLAAIGQTAGMVGHDIRNPLQAMTSDIYLLRSELTSLPAAELKNSIMESLDGIEGNIEYVNKIVSDLQDYTRPLMPNKVVIKVYDKIEHALKNVCIPNSIRLTVNVQDNLIIESDADFLRRALTNLINNAVQAMPDGGDLSIEAKRKEDKVVFAVQDTGVGIPEQVKPNLFKPLYTTKSKGQGLGLAVVKRLVESLDGSITFESSEGKGTKFIIELPQKNN